MICNKCNHELPDDSEFCQYCGNKIQNVPIETSESMQATNATKDFTYPTKTKSGLIIGIFLFLSFAQVLHPYLESDLYDYSLLLGVTDFCFLCILMMLIPMLIGIINKD